jgi:sirohydrochlorin cobaltochelatase
MSDVIERCLENALTDFSCFGHIRIQRRPEGGFVLSHREDAQVRSLQEFTDPEDAAEIAHCDDAGKYRSLKTAPNLRHGWRLEVADIFELRRALDHFYPGRLAIFAAWKKSRLTTTSLRATLDRQSGMYRVAAKISDGQIDDLVASFCRSNGGCLRTILWKRDAGGAVATAKLPPEKFDPSHDQTGKSEASVPLLCQEPCNLLVAECRNVVKMEGTAPPAPE